MMEQWHALKKQAGPALLLFRLGDFYEAFHEDAETLSTALNVTLTKRHEIPMAGIPFHSLDGYLKKLIETGHIVALAEQVEDPKEVKGIVKRAIVRTISPGTDINQEKKSANYFASIVRLNSVFGLTLLDLSTGELKLVEVENASMLFDELDRTKPSEILISDSFKAEGLLDELKHHFSFRVTLKEAHLFDHRLCLEFLLKHFNVQTLDGFGLKGLTAGINSAGSLLSYVKNTLGLSISHVKKLQKITLDNFQLIDATTMRHLEIAALFDKFDFTSTAMGNRLLKSFFNHPLLSVTAIEERQKCVETLISPLNLTTHLKPIADLSRIITRILMDQSRPRDLLSLKTSLREIPAIRTITNTLPALGLTFTDVSDIESEIERILVEEPGQFLIKEGVSTKLDELKALKTSAQDYLASYQAKLRETLQIKTLKVAYNKAFGYYIEIPRSQSAKMPDTFTRRQTLVNNERFISDELSEFEVKILTAEDQILALERQIYEELLTTLKANQKRILNIADNIAKLDCFLSLSIASKRFNLTKPHLSTDDRLKIIDGRHPLLDTPSFVPNDCVLTDQKRLAIITGPNMAGKSTYLRQVALITFLAHIGSFVPATEAKIGLVDKIFSRIGASDDLMRGQSTFMVEMVETANILNNATPRSLVILDEIGRGTSTYDGIAIAWAVAEELKNTKTLFATHYWELNALEKLYPQVMNFNVAVAETESGIVFLHKIAKGGTDKSYGIHVARLAGLPQSALTAAEKRLKSLEKEQQTTEKKQLTFFEEDTSDKEAIIEEILKLEPNEMTPMQALERLMALKQRLS